MIRSEFGIEPFELSNEQFAELWTEAAWLDQHRTLMLARALGFNAEMS
ncbi:MAG: hypothetical protein JNL05_10565 [Flavobacteriales bacterium]|nr:hypothetical protein [Flavobacteriales bacterium]